MGKVGWKAGQVIVGFIVVFCVGFSSSSFSDEDTLAWSKEEASIRSLDDLLNAYSSQANSLLPIIFPGSSIMPFESRLVFDDLSAAWPVGFLERLKTCGVERANSVVVHEILIQLHPKTHAFQILSGRGELLWEVERAPGYRTTWFSIECFADQRVSSKIFKQHCELFNPVRIVGVYTLINTEAALALAEINSVAESLEAESFSSVMDEPMAMMMSGGTPTDFRIAVEKNTNSSVNVLIEWSTGCLNTNMVDFLQRQIYYSRYRGKLRSQPTLI